MNEISLTAVLEEYALAAPDGFDRVILRQMTDKYPQFAADLRDYAAARAVALQAPEPDLTPEEEARYQQLGLQNLRAVLGEMSASAAAAPIGVLESLTDTAKAKGLNRSKFAAALGVSVSLVQYFEKRRLEFATIPRFLVKKIADVLETSEELVAQYLGQGAVGLANASFKASERPEELKPKSFADAVREDQTLSADEKRRLLNL